MCAASPTSATFPARQDPLRSTPKDSQPELLPIRPWPSSRSAKTSSQKRRERSSFSPGLRSAAANSASPARSQVSESVSTMNVERSRRRVDVRPEQPEPGLDELEGEAVERPGGGEPDVLGGPPVQGGPELLGQRLADAGVHAVGGDDQVVVAAQGVQVGASVEKRRSTPSSAARSPRMPSSRLRSSAAKACPSLRSRTPRTSTSIADQCRNSAAMRRATPGRRRGCCPASPRRTRRRSRRCRRRGCARRHHLA